MNVVCGQSADSKRRSIKPKSSPLPSGWVLLEAIDWIGFTRSVNRELAKINLFTLPSLFGEGLPMVVLEAMAAGLPVIASRVEGVPEAVVHRETGLLVEPGSVSQLVQAIEEFITGGVDYGTLSHGARVRHAELFSDTTMAAGVANVYRDVLARTQNRVGSAKRADFLGPIALRLLTSAVCGAAGRLLQRRDFRRRASNQTARSAARIRA